MQSILPELGPQQATIQFLTPSIVKYKIKENPQPNQQTIRLIFENKIIAEVRENGGLIFPAPWHDLPMDLTSLTEIKKRRDTINNYFCAMTRTAVQRSQYISELNRLLHDEESLYETSASEECDSNHRPYIKIVYNLPSNGSHQGFTRGFDIYSSWNQLSIDLEKAKEFTKQAEQEFDKKSSQNIRISE